MCEKQKVGNYAYLETLAEVARTYPMSLPRLAQLESYLPSALDQPFDMYLKVNQSSPITLRYKFHAISILQCYYELLTCCHTLKKIYVILPAGLLQLAQGNRYLAAIKAIDPDAVEFYVT